VAEEEVKDEDTASTKVAEEVDTKDAEGIKTKAKQAGCGRRKGSEKHRIERQVPLPSNSTPNLRIHPRP